MLPACLQNRDRLLDGEVSFVGEDIAILGKPAIGHLRDHLVDEKVDIPGTVLGKLRRKGVSAEEGRDQIGSIFTVEEAHRLQKLQLARGVETVAALHFDRGRSVSKGTLHQRTGPLDNLLERRLANRAHRTPDAASRFIDLLVACPTQPHRKLVRAVAGKNEVRVGVDVAGKEDTIATVEPLRVVVRSGERAGGSDLGDRLAIDQTVDVLQKFDRPHVGTVASR